MKIRLTIFCLFFSTLGFSQSYEFGIMGGFSNYHGDLAHNIVPLESHISGGAFFKYNFNEYWAFRPTISRLTISGNDKNFDEYYFRNLSFKNRITEFSGIFEFNYQPFSIRSTHQNTTFYSFAGVGLMMHNPKTLYKGSWVELQPLQTEGSSNAVKYSKTQLVIPFGVGVKHALTKNLIVGAEVGWRKTFTDYLDDVSNVYISPVDFSSQTARDLSDRSWEVSENGSHLANPGDQRGDPNLNDWYFQAAFTISYRLTPIQCPF